MMPGRLKRFYALAISIGLAALLLGLSLVVPVVGTATDFSIYNTGWNGTSNIAIKTYQAGKFVPSLELRGTGAQVEPAIISLDHAGINPADSSIIIIGPSKAFTDADGDYVSDFLAKGGVVVLADDFGTGNSLLERLDTSSSFSNGLVVDLAFEKKPEFVVAYNFDPESPITENVSMALLNYPSSISPSPTASVLATTSAASWVDTEPDQFKAPGEPSGPFPIITLERVGRGLLLLVSDPSIMINSMADQLDNQVLVDNILEFASAGRSAVLIDESHRMYFDPISFSSGIVGSLSDEAKLTLIIVIIVSFFLATTDTLARITRFTVKWSLRIWRALTRPFRKEGPEEADRFMSDDELMEKVLERHPEWNKGVLRRLLRQIERHGAVRR
jgi:hypothetical protein